MYNTLDVPWLLQSSNKNLSDDKKQKLLFKYKAEDAGRSVYSLEPKNKQKQKKTNK